MQLDRTEIVIRQRSTLELFDLSLQVFKRHWWAIAITSALLGVPLLILDNLATAWMLNDNSLELAEQADLSASWRPYWHVTMLYILQFPLISLPTSVYLGNRLFYQALPIGQLIRRLWPIAGSCFLVLGVARLGLVGLLLELFIDRQVNFDFAVEFWFFIFAAAIALFHRAVSPFAPEILGLELCPLRTKSPGTISYRARSRALHRYTTAQNLPRFLAAACFGCLLYLMLDGAQVFALGAITGQWSWNAGFDVIRLQISLWCVGMFMAVFRFLSYLDNRIRLEGWEIELRLKAEAARLEAATPHGAATTPPSQPSTQTAIHPPIKPAGLMVLAGFVLGAVAWLCGTAPLVAAESAAESAVESAVGRAAQSLPISDWYDQQGKHFRPPEVTPADDDPVRTAGRVSPSPPPTASEPRSPAQPWFANWPGGEIVHLMQSLLFIVLGVGLVVLMAWLTYYSLRDYLPERYPRQQRKSVRIDPARMVDLPFESEPMDRDPLAAAQRAMQAGNYDEAIAFLLSYFWLALDQTRLIHLQRGKTNRMYLRELSQQPGLAAIVNSAVLPFEASYFGKHSVSGAQFLVAWQQVDAFHHGLQAATATSTGASTATPTAPLVAPLTADSPARDTSSGGEAAAASGRAEAKPGKGTLGLLLGISCLGAAGCDSWSSHAHPYGAVASPGANRSLNGLGLHRKLWESRGAKCTTPASLSPKLDRVDVIVLVGQTYEPPGIEARRWLEHWLASGQQRTLLYFGRDFNADILYRQQTLEELPQAHRRRGEELLRLRQAEELSARWQQLPGPVFCDWFYIDTQRVTQAYRQFQSGGPYMGQFAEVVATQALPGEWPMGVALQPPDSKLWRDELMHRMQQFQTTAASPTPPSESSLSSSAQPAHQPERPLRRSRWNANEFGDGSRWLDAVQDPLESEVLLSAGDGQPLIFRLTGGVADGARLGSGQIVIVANGFPILNGSLVTPLGAEVGQRLIDVCGPAERVALLAFDQQGVLISGTEESGLSGAGLEMLTVWPLSAITMPAALLGIIACAALWPILGRPQPLAQRSLSDLGLHVEAIGRLMSETHDQHYAAGAIAEYYRRVRGETPPAWLSEFSSPDLQPEGDDLSASRS